MPKRVRAGGAGLQAPLASNKAPLICFKRWDSVLHLYSQILLTIAGICIALGGLYDVCTPRLPANLGIRGSSDERPSIVVRELLRALGASLIAIGSAVALLARQDRDPYAVLLILVLVLPSEGMNAVGMYRVGSPYLIPLAFLALALIGSALAVLA